jgi:hypothetical protein
MAPLGRSSRNSRNAPSGRQSKLQLLAAGAGLGLIGWAQYILGHIVGGESVEAVAQVRAAILLILGMMAFGLGTRDLSLPKAVLEQAADNHASSWFQWTGKPIFLVGSVLLAILGIVMFAASGESALVRALWIGSVLSLLLSQLTVFWQRPAPLPATELRTLITLAAILAISLALGIYRLGTLPYNVDGDFADFGNQARDLLTGQQTGIFGFGWAAIPLLGFVPAWASMAVFGNNLVGLNASGVADGLLILIATYLLARGFFGVRVGLLSAATLAAGYAFMASSRQAQYIDPLVFMLFSVYLLLLGLRGRRPWAIVLSGFSTAFCFQMYYSGRLVVPLLAFMLLFLGIVNAKALMQRRGLLLLWAISMGVALGPMLVQIARGGDALSARTRDVFILDPRSIQHEKFTYAVSSVAGVLAEQARRSALMFHYYGDRGTQFGIRRPLLDPVTGVFFTIGLGFAMLRLRRLGAALMLAWILLATVLGAFLTINPPFWPRLIIVLAPAAILSASGLHAVIELIENQLPSRKKLLRQLPTLMAVLLIVAVGIRNWQFYVSATGTYAETRARIGRFLSGQPSSTRAYLVTSWDWTVEDRIFRFLAPDTFVTKLSPDEVHSAVMPIGQPTIFILTPDQTSLLEPLGERFPAGMIDTVAGNSPGEVGFHAFIIP